MSRFAADPGRMTFLPGGSLGFGDRGPIGPRYACGLLVVHVRGRSEHVYRRLYLTVSWPEFRFLGVNAPVDPGAPDGGLG